MRLSSDGRTSQIRNVADGLNPGTLDHASYCHVFLGWFFFARRRLLGSTKIDTMDASNLPILPVDAKSQPVQERPQNGIGRSDDRYGS